MFESGHVTVADRSYAYRLLAPPSVDTGPYPLIVFLHGIGERGDDNERQLTYLPNDLANAPATITTPAILQRIGTCGSYMGKLGARFLNDAQAAPK